MWLNEEQTRQEIYRYYKTRYQIERTDDVVHDGKSTSELIRELIDETGQVRLFYPGIGWMLCVAGQGENEFSGRQANTLGRAVANTFAEFVQKRIGICALP